MENLRKKNKTEIQNKMEGHSSRLDQMEDRISEVEDEMVMKINSILGYFTQQNYHSK
jgi:hypothetical protein